MSFANPWGLLLAGFVVPVVLLHVLRPRRTATTVSSTMLWRDLQRPVSAAAPWQKFRWSVLLILQLLAVLLAALAVARPVRLTDAGLAEHTVFIVDASGSMAAQDGSPDRLAAATAEAERLRDELPDGGIASIVVANDRPRVALTASSDRTQFTDALATIDPTAGRADFADAFALAQSLETGTADIGYVLLSDGGLTQEEQRLQPPGTTYRRIGARDLNRAITSFEVEPLGSSLHARATVKNTGGPAATVDVRFDVDGETAAVQRVELKPGLAIDVAADVPNGDRIEVFLSGTDLLSADDHAVTVGTTRPDLRVLLVGDPLFVGDLLASIPGVELTTVSADDPAATGEDADVVVYQGVAVPADVAAPFWAIAPPGGSPGVTVTGTVDAPAVTLLRSDDALVRDLDLTDVAIAAAQRVEAPLADELVGAEGAPLLLRGSTTTTAGRTVPYAYLSFALADSNLPVQVEFPLLGDRILTELAGATVAPRGLEVGAALPLTSTGAATITAPDGTTRSFEPGDAIPRATRPGFWAVTPDAGTAQLVAVNVPASESALATADELVKPPAAAASGGTVAKNEQALVHWVVLALLAVLVAEWLVARRRVGVGRRQWRIATGLRAAVAALLVLALVAPVIRRTTDRTATVFVVDLSASMGASGRRAAEEWVREALSARGDDDLAAVVGFGAEARLDRVLERSSAFDGAQVVIDDEATNLQAALRLADAVLVEDARRRVVIVSDGLATTGDTAEEIEQLRAGGTQVDVHTIDPVTGPDAAVDVLDAPTLARVGDVVRVSASVEATVAGPASVMLQRDGVEIARQDVELLPGSNEVTFTDAPDAAPGEVLRYQIVVDTSGDGRPENDVGFVSVPVEGPARVLVVEGTDGEADTLAAGLEAGGVRTEVIGVADLPSVADLVTYAGIVMVDVDARNLSGEQFETLSTVVRDLGKGLVTIGGERSYGVGGYRGSPLEELLPVISEVLDPKRRMTVAEVLSIDVSGSMANCHCDEGENPNGRIDGGVNKTDISRAAAARTVEALSASDELGILAWNQGSKWVVDLQQLPAADVVEDGLRQLVPAGSTNLRDSLVEAAEALRSSKAALKHIILFSDGFTDVAIIEEVADQAAQLYEEDGITVSVVATGEGAAPSLEDIAISGRGRYYPGQDLQQVPQVIAEEAVIASRDFITEGEFLPEITASTDVTASLTEAPVLLGYVATTPKGTATTSLRIGPDRDPLLATWQAGLGTVTSWTSDASAGWSKNWAGWDGYVGFWTSVVKDTFAAGDEAGAVDASLGDGTLRIEVADDQPFPDGATATAVVSGPDGQRIEVPLERSGGDRFTAEVPATRSGSYAVGVTVEAAGDTVLSSSALADESYPAEYRPAAADRAAMARWSAQSGGRGEIEPSQAFDRGTLTDGANSWPLRPLLLWLAALLWPVAVVISRLSLRGVQLADATDGARRIGRRVRTAVPKLLPSDPTERPTPPAPSTSARTPPPGEAQPSPAGDARPQRTAPVSPTPGRPPSAPAAPAAARPTAPPPPSASPSRTAGDGGSVNELLARKRTRRQRDEDGADPGTGDG